MPEGLALADLLREFDGRSVEPFREANALLPSAEAVLEQLVDLASEDEAALRIGATWLLKARLEAGTRGGPSVSAEMIRLLTVIEETDAQLHLLQSLPHLDLETAPEVRDVLRNRLHQLLDSKNTFVRAWSYNGLAVLGQSSDADREAALEAFDQVPAGEKASVKARIRHARKSLRG